MRPQNATDYEKKNKQVQPGSRWAAIFLGFVILSFLGVTDCVSPENSSATRTNGNEYNVRSFGATDDGKTLDTASINKAIIAAHATGGGTVWFPAGTDLSTSIRLKCNVTLHLGSSAVIEALPSPDATRASPPPSCR